MKHSLISVLFVGAFHVGCYSSLHTMQEDWESSRDGPSIKAEDLGHDHYDRKAYRVYQVEEDGNLYYSQQIILPLLDSPVSLRDTTTYHFKLELTLLDPTSEAIDAFQAQKSFFQNDVILFLSDHEESWLLSRRGKIDLLEELQLRMKKLTKMRRIDIHTDAIYMTRFYKISPFVSHTP